MQFPIKTLHITGQLEYGGITSWLQTLVQAHDPQQLSIDICCNFRKTSGILAEEFKQKGCSIFHIPFGANPIRYHNDIIALCKAHRYDIVHDHRSFLSGATLRAAKRAGVPVRIMHHHTPNDDLPAGIIRKLYCHVLKKWSLKHATKVLGCSASTLSTLYGNEWQNTEFRCEIFHPGFSVRQASPNARAIVRGMYGIPEDHKVIGFVCKMARPKNPFIALDVCFSVLDKMDSASVLWVGEGPLLADIKMRAQGHRHASRVYFAGAPKNIADILAAIDVYYLPSLWEGLPLGVLEALSAGLPVVGSRAPGLMEALPLSMHGTCFEANDSAAQAQAIHNILSSQVTRSVPETFLKPFLAPQMCTRLLDLYQRVSAHSLPKR